MHLEMLDDGTEVDAICERIRFEAAAHPLPRKVLDVRDFLRLLSDNAFRRLLLVTIDAYRGNLFDVSFVLGLSESGVYQAVRRFGLWPQVAEARDGRGEESCPLNQRDAAPQKIY